MKENMWIIVLILALGMIPFVWRYGYKLGKSSKDSVNSSYALVVVWVYVLIWVAIILGLKKLGLYE